MTDRGRITMSFKRNDLCYLIDALEAIIEDFKYDGGLVLAEDYIRMEERLTKRLRSHDRTPFRSSSSTAAVAASQEEAT